MKIKKRKTVRLNVSYEHFEQKSLISMNCSVCFKPVEKVDAKKISVKCWKCVLKELPYEEPKQIKKSEFPPGWKILPVYVHKNGDVYHRGKLKPKFKGTLPPTEIKIRKRRKKKEIDAEKERKLIKKYKSISKKKRREKKKKKNELGRKDNS